jgi:hypothetical protein
MMYGSAALPSSQGPKCTKQVINSGDRKTRPLRTPQLCLGGVTPPTSGKRLLWSCATPTGLQKLPAMLHVLFLKFSEQTAQMAPWGRLVQGSWEGHAEDSPTWPGGRGTGRSLAAHQDFPQAQRSPRRGNPGPAPAPGSGQVRRETTPGFNESLTHLHVSSWLKETSSSRPCPSAGPSMTSNYPISTQQHSTTPTLELGKQTVEAGGAGHKDMLP